jgi:hypothetical protein
MVIAPMTWLRAVFGFRMRPAAQTASMRRTRISPVAASTPTSTKVRAEGRLLVLLVEVAVLDRVFGHQPFGRAALLRQRMDAAIARRTSPSRTRRRSR